MITPVQGYVYVRKCPHTSDWFTYVTFANGVVETLKFKTSEEMAIGIKKYFPDEVKK